MQIVIQLLILVSGLVLLIKGACWLIEGASKIAGRFGVLRLNLGPAKESDAEEPEQGDTIWKWLIMFVIGGALIVWGSGLVVDAMTALKIIWSMKL